MAKVRQAQDTSDIGTDMETEVPPKRIMRFVVIDIMLNRPL